MRLRSGPPAGVRVAGPVALPPADQRVSAARSPLGVEGWGEAEAADAAMTSARPSQPANKAIATNRINDMCRAFVEVFATTISRFLSLYTWKTVLSYIFAGAAPKPGERVLPRSQPGRY